MNYKIKLASFDEIQLMLGWAAAEGWNPGLNDAQSFQLIDLKGFFIGHWDGEPVSCISLVKYTADFGFLGLYLVKPEYRGKGLGYQIWQHAMKYAGQCNIGLDGVTAQQSNYQKSGFKLAHKNIRYSANTFEHRPHQKIISASSLPLHHIVEYDRLCFPCERSTFLSSWLLMTNATSLVYIDKEIKGYGVIRKCHQGYKVGPLFAENSEIAQALLLALVNSVQATEIPIFLDIPETNLAANHLVQELAMTPVFETARMYTKEFPALSVNKIFGITTFEMG